MVETTGGRTLQGWTTEEPRPRLEAHCPALGAVPSFWVTRLTPPRGRSGQLISSPMRGLLPLKQKHSRQFSRYSGQLMKTWQGVQQVMDFVAGLKYARGPGG
ncbi:hypothetical protein [Caballeronia sp. INML1]|uniref:hypothetical protein n=1 Tax=unclassified Caballeronia TaxID=2646786 RepID=UPI0039057C47